MTALNKDWAADSFPAVIQRLNDEAERVQQEVEQ
jgi:hypothetical protein